MTGFPFRPPARLTLAVDTRLADAPVGDEHIWTLHAAYGMPAALTAVTTYGLRVQEMAIFPFVESEGQPRWASSAFARAPQWVRFSVGYAHLVCEPFPGLQLTCRYWVAQPHVLVGQLALHNLSQTNKQGVLGLAALLRALPGEKSGMMPQTRGAVHLLQGEAGGVQPLLFLTGGAEGALSPFPSLRVPFDLSAGGVRRLTWVQTALNDAEAGFAMARQMAARSWAPHQARLEMLDARTPAVETASPAGAWAFARARQMAHRLMQPIDNLPRPFFVTSRETDHGGPADPLALNRAPSVTEAYHLAVNYFLPTHPTPVQGWVADFFARQQEDGFVPWKPAHAQQGHLASPLLAELAYRAWAHDRAGWSAYAEPLRRFVEAWYVHGDRNRDGFPEWRHSLQMGLPDVPAFSPWQRASVGSDFSKVESPALYALLYRALERMEDAMEAAGNEPPPDARARRRTLRAAVQAMWDSRRRVPLYRDYETHERPPQRNVGKGRGSGTFALEAVLESPARVVVHVFPAGGGVRPVTVVLRGRDAHGKPVEEQISGGKIAWHDGRGVATSTRVFKSLANVEITGLRSRCRWVVLTPVYDFPDVSLLLPFWAKMLTEDQAEAVRRALVSPHAFGHAFGIPLASRGGKKAADWLRAVYMPWVTFAVEGLLAHGFIADAAHVLSASARAVERTLTDEGGFREAYHADTGAGMGGRESLTGLLPMGLWARVAGVQLMTPHRIRFAWPTPFDEEIVVRVWGWQIRRSPAQTEVRTPDGQMRVLNVAEPYEVEAA